jgi:hypothetical protein
MKNAIIALFLCCAALLLGACSIFQPGDGEAPDPNGVVLTRADIPGNGGVIEIVYAKPPRH